MLDGHGVRGDRPARTDLGSARSGAADVLCVDLDRTNQALDVPLNMARPWQRTAATGVFYEPHRSTEPRSTDHTTI